MSIFGNRKPNTTEPVVENAGFVLPTTEGLDMILTESALDSYKVRAAMYVSDVMMEEAVIEGAADPEVLMESFVKGLFAKLKEIFQRLAAKIKEWYNQFKRSLALLFTSGEDFVKKFESEIKTKSVKGFKYKGYKYDLDPATVNPYMDKLKGVMNKYSNNIEDVDNSAAQEEALKNKADYAESYDTADEKEKTIQALGFDSIQELLDKVRLDFHGGEEEKVEIEAFAANGKDEMMAHIKNKSKALSIIENGEKATLSQLDRIIKALDKAASKFKDEAKGKVATYVSHASEMLRYSVSIMVSLYRVEAQIIKEAARDYESTLKTFLRFKPAKEGVEDVTEPGAESLLEAAMKLI